MKKQTEEIKLAVGQAVFIRTVTFYYTGRIIALGADFITLNQAAWIADTGRFHLAMRDGFDSQAEIEPYPPTLPVHVARGAIVDIAEWRHPLPDRAN